MYVNNETDLAVAKREIQITVSASSLLWFFYSFFMCCVRKKKNNFLFLDHCKNFTMKKNYLRAWICANENNLIDLHRAIWADTKTSLDILIVALRALEMAFMRFSCSCRIIKFIYWI
jgi:hypothetical protein